MRPYAWSLPVQVYFGVGCAEEAADRLQGRRTVVLAYPGAHAHEPSARFARSISDGLLDWIEIPEGLSTVSMGKQLALKVWPALARDDGAVLLGLGGGSVMDLAKWLRFRPLSGDPWELEQLCQASALPPNWVRHPLWLLPTTAGTGSEVTRWSTLWDTDAQPLAKRSFDRAFSYADCAVVDPTLGMSCPASALLSAALDAFAHSLEVIWNRHRNPISLSLAVGAARRILHALPVALGRPEDLDARVCLAQAALEAGVAFSQTRTALAHALSYEVTLTQGVPHGSAVAVWLPLVWAQALGHHPEVDTALGQVFDAPAIQGPERLDAWFKEIGFETSLSRLGIDDAQARVERALCTERGRNFVNRGAHG